MQNQTDIGKAKGFAKDLLSTQTALLQLEVPQSSPYPISPVGLSILAIHQRIGGLMAELAAQSQIRIESLLAVWQVESGPYGFEKGRPLLRFEVHKFWQHWGSTHEEIFDKHFQFGGHGSIPGSSWSNHKFFDAMTSSWLSFHGDQTKEYQAFELAASLADTEFACQSSSFGGPQILGSNHAHLGYSNARELYEAFATSERWQVCGFFDFCFSHNLLDALREGNWLKFAEVYNGPGQAPIYAERINDAYVASLALLQGLPEPIAQFDVEAFNTFFATLGVQNFKPHEFLYRGLLNSTIGHAAYGKNILPPPELWPQLAPLAQVLDQLRRKIGAPITLTSIYRTEAYNRAVNGSAESRHMGFAAVDFRIKDGGSPVDWCTKLRKLRQEGLFTGCVGQHKNAVHLDLRQVNVDF